MALRHDLVRQLTSVEGASADLHQKSLDAVNKICQAANSTLQKVIDNPNDDIAMGQLPGAERRLDDALRQLRREREAHTHLPSDERAVSLQNELGVAETRLFFARETFNDLAANYNAARNQFPSRLIASKLGFAAFQFFDIPQQAQAAR